MLRYVPYFGENADDNTLDVSYFEVLPTELNDQEKISEVDETIALVCSTRWSNADDLFIDYMCKGRGFKVTDLADRVKTRLSNTSKWRALFPDSFGKKSFQAKLSDWRCMSALFELKLFWCHTHTHTTTQHFRVKIQAFSCIWCQFQYIRVEMSLCLHSVLRSNSFLFWEINRIFLLPLPLLSSLSFRKRVPRVSS